MKRLILSGLLISCSSINAAPFTSPSLHDSVLEQAEALNVIINSDAVSDSLHQMAILHTQKGELIAALQCWEQNISILEKLDDKKALAESYRMAGMLYSSVGSVEKGMDDLSKALRISTALNDSLGNAQVRQCLGDVGLMQHNFQEAILHYVLGYNFIPHDNDMVRAQFLSREGYSYQGVGLYDLALSYYKRSLKIYSNTNDTIGIAKAMNDIGNIYKINGKIDTALNYFEVSAFLYEQLNDSFEIATPLHHIADCWLALNNSHKGLKYAEMSYGYAIRTGMPAKIRDAAKRLSDVYAVQHDYRQSLEYYREYTLLKDSLLNDKNKLVIINSKINFQLEQEQQQSKEEKDNLNAIASLQARNQQFIIYVIIGILAVALLISFLLYRNNRQKRKSEKQLLEKNALIEEQKQRAEKSEKFKSQFLANMSHEIRTPMTAVLGFTNLMVDEQDEEKRLEYLSAVKKSSENLLVIINDILDLSKLEAGKVTLEKIPFRLRDQLDFIFETFASKAESKGLKMEVTIADDVPEFITGDPARLTQVLVNLVGNAVKFTERGEVQLAVSSGQLAVGNLQTANCQLQFEIKDTGIGIPKDQVQKIFESFTQAHVSDNRKFGGTGLGLTISKNLVEAMGGELTVRSEYGAGSVFSFTLLFESASATQWQTQQKKDFLFEEDLGEELSEISILIAEDNPYNQLLISDTLRKFIPFVQIEVAGNGREVLAVLEAMHESHNTKHDVGTSNIENFIRQSFNAGGQKSKPDVILMDVQMPEMDGYETTREIRNPQSFGRHSLGEGDAQIRNHNIPIIALTASVIRSDIDKCQAMGMNGYVPKPFKAAELLREIARVLGKETYQVSSESIDYSQQDGPSGLVDLQHLREITNGDGQQLKKYLSMFLELILQRNTELQQALKNNNWMQVRSVVHAMKPLFASVGLAAAVKTSKLIEENCGNEVKPVKEAHSLIATSDKAMIEIRKQLDQIMSTIS